MFGLGRPPSGMYARAQIWAKPSAVASQLMPLSMLSPPSNKICNRVQMQWNLSLIAFSLSLSLTLSVFNSTKQVAGTHLVYLIGMSNIKCRNSNDAKRSE